MYRGTLTHALSIIVLSFLSLYPALTDAKARVTFNVHYPWASRKPPAPKRAALAKYDPFCGEIIRSPRGLSSNETTFLSFNGHPGDLVSGYWTSKTMVPKGKEDFPDVLFKDIAIFPSGQLCLDHFNFPQELIRNKTAAMDVDIGENGILLFEVREPVEGGVVEYYCQDVRLVPFSALGSEHPAMCAGGNKTMIPMPDEYL